MAKLELKPEERPKIDPNFEEATEGEEVEKKEKLKSKWARLEAMVGTDKRIELVAKDLVNHVEKRFTAMEGKAMVVGMSRRICAELYSAIVKLRPSWHHDDDDKGLVKVVMTGSAADDAKLQPHIRNKKRREDLAKRFKDENDPLKLVIVRGGSLEYRAPHLRSDQLGSNAEALTKARTELLFYVQKVNDDAGKTGLKVYDVLLGSAVRDDLRRDLPSGIADARFGNPLNIDSHSYRQMLDAAGTLESQMHALAEFGKLAEHPWRGFQNIEITELDETRLVSLVSTWNRAIYLALDDIKAIEHRVGCALPMKQVDVEDLCRRLAAAPLPPEVFSADMYRQCFLKEDRDRVRAVLDQFARLKSNEAALETSSEDVSASRNIGSKAIEAAIDGLNKVGVAQFDVSSLLDLKEESRRTANLVPNITPFCSMIVESVGLKQLSIGALRGCTAALDLLARLPRPLWSKRSASVLDEANRRVLERGLAQSAALTRRRAALDVVFDLDLLPKAEELRAHGLALRSANALTALFSASCRRARKVFRGFVRDLSKKHRRTDMANGLLGCGQFLADLDAFGSSTAFRPICEKWFAGLETPFSELLDVSIGQLTFGSGLLLLATRAPAYKTSSSLEALLSWIGSQPCESSCHFRL